jgi:hypothetical protein
VILFDDLEARRAELEFEELLEELDREDRAGVRGECLGPDPTVEPLEYHDWHCAL